MFPNLVDKYKKLLTNTAQSVGSTLSNIGAQAQALPQYTKQTMQDQTQKYLQKLSVPVNAVNSASDRAWGVVSSTAQNEFKNRVYNPQEGLFPALKNAPHMQAQRKMADVGWKGLSPEEQNAFVDFNSGIAMGLTDAPVAKGFNIPKINLPQTQFNIPKIAQDAGQSLMKRVENTLAKGKSIGLTDYDELRKLYEVSVPPERLKNARIPTDPREMLDDILRATQDAQKALQAKTARFTKGKGGRFTGSQSAAGAIAGVQQDEDGNITFDPTAAALGVAGTTIGMKAVKRLSPQADDVLKTAKGEIQSVRDAGKTPFKQTVKDFYTDWVNRFQPIEDVADLVGKKTNIPSSQDPRYLLKRLMGAGGVAEYRHKKVLQPILDELGDINKGDFDVFLKAKRDMELAQRGIKGSDASVAQVRMEALAQKYDPAQLEAVAGKLYQYQDEGLQSLREAGFINDMGYNTIKGQNQSYVPFKRVMDELDNYLGLPTNKTAQGTNPLQKIKGSERAIYSPLEEIIANTYKIEAAVSKNKVAQSIVNLRNLDPKLADVFTPTTQGGANTIPVWEGGRKVFYEAPEDIVRAVKGLNEEGLGTIEKILSAPARLLRQGATGRNIDFMIPNVFKDQFDAAVSAKFGYTPFVDYLRGLAHLARYDITGSDEIVEGWIKNGGEMFFENMAGRKELAKQVSDAVDGKRLTKRVGEWVLGGIDFLGRYSEKPTRLGLYGKALKKTGDPLVAAAESREGTLDFARMGAKMKVANSIIPFLNVGVQGFDKMLRTARTNPGAFALKMGLYGVAPATAISVYNNKFFPEEYSEIPDYEKETNFILVNGRDSEGRPVYTKLPKGNIVPLIANPVDHMISYLAGTNQRSFGNLAMAVLGDALPILETGDSLEQTASKTVGSILPQAVKPAIESIANYNFFKGREIVPFYKQDKLPSEQTWDDTPETYKYLGGVLNQSPLQVENFLEGTLAGGAKVPSDIVELIKGNVEEGKGINNTPVLRRFQSVGFTPDETAQYRAKKEEKDAIKQVNREMTPSLLERVFPVGEAGASSTAPVSTNPAVVKAKEDAIRSKVKRSGEPAEYNGKLFYVNENGESASVYLDRPLEAPKLTGQAQLDKELIADYKGSISAKINDTVKLYELGKLSPQEAGMKILQMKALQEQIKKTTVKAKKIPVSKIRSLTAPIKVKRPKSVKRTTETRGKIQVRKVNTRVR